MEKYLTKYNLSEDKIEQYYDELSSKLGKNNQQIRELLLNSDEKHIIKLFASNKELAPLAEKALLLRAYEIENYNNDESVITSDNSGTENIKHNFKAQSVQDSVIRKYFSPIGNSDGTVDGQITSDTGTLCGADCNGVITGKFLNQKTDSVLAYWYSNGSFRYNVASIDDVSFSKSISGTVDLSNLAANTIKANVVDVNNDGLDDLVVSSIDANTNSNPVLVLNSNDSSFNQAIAINLCSSNYGNTKLYTGNYLGPNSASMLCTQNNGINNFYKITYDASSNTVSTTLAISKTNWCNTPSKIVSFDFNGDKFTDVMCVTNNQQNLLLSNNGEELKSTSPNSNGSLNLFTTNIQTESIITGDFDGNGNEDILRTDANGNNYLYLSNGKNFFPYIKTTQADKFFISIGSGKFCSVSNKYVAGKFNNDKTSDLYCSTSSNDNVMFSRLESDVTLPKVSALLHYKNFNLNMPADLSPYAINIVSSERYVNAKSQGAIKYEAPLSLNTKLMNDMTSFHDDITSSDNVISGKVVYLRDYITSNDILSSDVTLAGYKIDSSNKESIEFDWFVPRQIFTKNIVSQWDEINLQNKVEFSLKPNQCVNAQITASLYQDIPVPFTAKGYLSLKDEDGQSLLGDRLKYVANQILSKPVILESNNEVSFDTNGILNQNILFNVETSVKECDTPSPLQSSKLPMVHVLLTYRDFSFSVPGNYQQNAQVVTASKTITNNKKYGVVEYKTPLSLEAQLSQSLDSFYNDIKPNDLVIDGKVHYLGKFDELQYQFNNKLTGYTVDYKNIGEISHDWFLPVSKVSSDVISHFGKLKVTDEAVLELVPGQCVNAQMQATIYKQIPVYYTANGYFTAKDEDGYQLQGQELLAVAQNIFNKDVTLNNNGDVVFGTSGTLLHNIVGNIATQVLDC